MEQTELGTPGHSPTQTFPEAGFVFAKWESKCQLDLISLVFFFSLLVLEEMLSRHIESKQGL